MIERIKESLALTLGKKGKKEMIVVNIPGAKPPGSLELKSSGNSVQESTGLNKFDQRISLDPIHDFERRREKERKGREGKRKENERGTIESVFREARENIG